MGCGSSVDIKYNKINETVPIKICLLNMEFAIELNKITHDKELNSMIYMNQILKDIDILLMPESIKNVNNQAGLNIFKYMDYNEFELIVSDEINEKIIKDKISKDDKTEYVELRNTIWKKKCFQCDVLNVYIDTVSSDIDVNFTKNNETKIINLIKRPYYAVKLKINNKIMHFICGHLSGGRFEDPECVKLINERSNQIRRIDSYLTKYVKDNEIVIMGCDFNGGPDFTNGMYDNFKNNVFPQMKNLYSYIKNEDENEYKLVFIYYMIELFNTLKQLDWHLYYPPNESLPSSCYGDNVDWFLIKCKKKTHDYYYNMNNGNIEIRQTTNLKINNKKYNCKKITELSDHNAVVLTLYI